eukprot:g54894.t1
MAVNEQATECSMDCTQNQPNAKAEGISSPEQDTNTVLRLKQIEDIKTRACSLAEPQLVVCSGKLERLRATWAFNLWKIRALPSSAPVDLGLEAQAKRLAYDAGVQSENNLRLLFELDAVVGGDQVRAARKALVKFLKTELIARFDAIRASALRLERVAEYFAARVDKPLQEHQPPATSVSTSAQKRKSKKAKKGKKGKRGKANAPVSPKAEGQVPKADIQVPIDTSSTDEDEDAIEEVPADAEVDLETVVEEPMRDVEVQNLTQQQESMQDVQESNTTKAKQDVPQETHEDSIEGMMRDVEEQKEAKEVEEQKVEKEVDNEPEEEAEEGEEEEDTLAEAVSSLRQHKPRLKYPLQLRERALGDGSLLLWADMPGVTRDSYRVKVDNAKRTLSIFGLARTQQVIREPMRDIWGMVRYAHRQVPVTKWFQETFSIPASFDLRKVEYTLQDQQLRIVLPSQPAAERRRRRAASPARRCYQPQADPEDFYNNMNPFAGFSNPWLF